jgi:hypothetical protein
LAKVTKKQGSPKSESIALGSQKARGTVWKSIARIQERWGFNAASMARLLHTKPPTFHSWKEREEIPVSQPPLTPDMEVVVAVIAIHRSLSAMFSNPHDQVAWLTAKHPTFEVTPIEFAIKSSANLFQLRSYLDFVRGRGA